jgi:hypothetical protein
MPTTPSDKAEDFSTVKRRSGKRWATKIIADKIFLLGGREQSRPPELSIVRGVEFRCGNHASLKQKEIESENTKLV